MDKVQYYEEKARYGLYERYQDMSKKLGFVFWIFLVANVPDLFGVSVYLVAEIFQNSDLLTNAQIIFYLMSCIAAILIGIFILTMREYDSQLGTAGIMFMTGQVLYTIQEFFKDTCFGVILSMVSAAAMIIYIICCTRALSALTFNLNSSLANSWDLLRKVCLVSQAVMVGAAFLLIIPFINILAALAIFLSSLILLSINIWQMILFFLTSRAMAKCKLEEIE